MSTKRTLRAESGEIGLDRSVIVVVRHDSLVTHLPFLPLVVVYAAIVRIVVAGTTHPRTAEPGRCWPHRRRAALRSLAISLRYAWKSTSMVWRLDATNRSRRSWS